MSASPLHDGIQSVSPGPMGLLRELVREVVREELATMQGATAGPDTMKIPEVAALLRRSVKSTYRIAAAGELPGATKVGGLWAVSRVVLVRSIAEGRVPPRRSRR